MRRHPLLPALVVLALASAAHAAARERFELRNGTKIEGSVIGESAETIIVRSATGIRAIERADLVKREETAPPGDQTPAPGGLAPPRGVARMEDPNVHDPEVDAFVANRDKHGNFSRELRVHLKGLAPDRALDVMMTLYLAAKGDRKLREGVLYHLEYCRGAGKLPLAYETAARDDSDRVRGMAVKGLATLAAAEPPDGPVRKKADVLVRRALRSEAYWDRQYGVYAAAKLWGERGIPELLRLARGGIIPGHSYRAVASVEGGKGIEALKKEYRTHPLSRGEVKRVLAGRLGKSAAELFFKTVATEDAGKGLAWRLGLPVSFSLVDVPLRQAVKFLEEQAKVRLVLDPKVGNQKRPVTLGVRNLSVHEAIYSLCFGAGLAYRIERDVVRIVPGKVKPLRSRRPPDPKLSGKMNADFQGTPVTEAISFVQTMTRVNCLLSPDARERAAKVTVTLKVKDRTVRTVLADLAKRIGAQLVVRGSVAEFH